MMISSPDVEDYTGTDSPLLQCHMLQRDIPPPALWQLDDTAMRQFVLTVSCLTAQTRK